MGRGRKGRKGVDVGGGGIHLPFFCQVSSSIRSASLAHKFEVVAAPELAAEAGRSGGGRGWVTAAENQKAADSGGRQPVRASG